MKLTYISKQDFISFIVKVWRYRLEWGWELDGQIRPYFLLYRPSKADW